MIYHIGICGKYPKKGPKICQNMVYSHSPYTYDYVKDKIHSFPKIYGLPYLSYLKYFKKLIFPKTFSQIFSHIHASAGYSPSSRNHVILTENTHPIQRILTYQILHPNRVRKVLDGICAYVHM